MWPFRRTKPQRDALSDQTLTRLDALAGRLETAVVQLEQMATNLDDRSK